METVEILTFSTIRDILRQMPERTSQTWVISVLEKVRNFLFVFSILLLVLYILGNLQNFLDRSQIVLLKVLMVATLIGGILSLYSFLYRMIFGALHGRFSFGRIFSCILIFLFNASVLIVLKFFSAWFQI